MWGRKTSKAVDGITTTPVAPDTPAVLVEELTNDWAQELSDMRGWVASCVADNDPPLNLEDPPTALAVIEALLHRGGIMPEETWKLQALGAVLGDAMGTDLGIPWRLVTDQWGSTPGLHLGRDDVAYPLTMIAKRVENGEDVDVHHLFVTLTDQMRQLIDRR